MATTTEDIEVLLGFCSETEELLSEVDEQVSLLQEFVFYQPFDLSEYIVFLQQLTVADYLEALRSINRFVHTVKGTSAFLELQNLNRFCHQFEELTIDLTNGIIYLEQTAFTLIKQLPNIITRFLEFLKDEHTDAKVQVDAELDEISTCKESLTAAMAGEKIDLSTIQKIDLGLVRQTKKTIKMSLNLDTHDAIIDNLQAAIHETLNMVSMHKMPSEAVFEINKIMNEQLDRIIMSSQAPIVLSRYQRIVIDLGKSLGKEIVFMVTRNEANARPDVWDRCHNALVHLVRNAVDHGIEKPGERTKLGKPAQGKLEMDLHEDHKNIYITLGDDGRGIDEHKIGESALAKGVITQAELSSMTAAEVHRLIFKPGFSTKATATDVSGRGVGMDAVVKEIEDNLNGRVSIETEKNKGTTFHIEIPKAATLTECILFGNDAYVYAIPKIADVEYIDCNSRYINTIANKPVYTEGAVPVPLINLIGRYHPNDRTAGQDSCRRIIKIKGKKRSFGLLVPTVFGHQLIKIERDNTLSKLVNQSGSVYGYGLTDPITVVLDLDYLEDLFEETN
ncbi:MAG: hypothetical protein GY868_14800 [Deltaproteobacteria bacterium]|nr:hypothetical protein [Deltaproteobacteria bacterium]